MDIISPRTQKGRSLPSGLKTIYLQIILRKGSLLATSKSFSQRAQAPLKWYTLAWSIHGQTDGGILSQIGFEKILTPEQLALLQEQNELVKSQREAFKNSLTDEQLAILVNESLNRRERREALRATFTQDQLDLLDTHKTNVQALKDSFRESLTDEQKQKLKKRRQGLKEKKQQLNQKKRQIKKKIKKKKSSKN